jgi:hypothetical protein
MGGPGEGVAPVLVVTEGAAHGVADVEAAARAAQVPLLPPPDVAVHLVGSVEALALDEARGEALPLQ